MLACLHNNQSSINQTASKAVFKFSRNMNVTRAPLSPTTSELHAMHPLSAGQLGLIQETRTRINDVLERPESGLLAIVGACALTDNLPVLTREAAAMRAVEVETPGLVTAERENGWKPRSNPKSWHGMESTEEEVERAHELITTLAGSFGNVAMELGYKDHADRYARTIALGWLGARNSGDLELLLSVAAHRNIPIGIKNGEDGDIETALRRVEIVDRIRKGLSGAAVLLYRGGSNALNPHDWEKNYLYAHQQTSGKLIVDTAHGAMRAHAEGNGKSLDGQRRAADHVLELAARGYAPAGILMEASGTESVVDPNLPHEEAIAIVQTLANIKAGMYESVS